MKSKRPAKAARRKKYAPGKDPASHKPYKHNRPPLPPLQPHMIVRYMDGPFYFGFKLTAQQAHIDRGDSP